VIWFLQFVFSIKAAWAQVTKMGKVIIFLHSPRTGGTTLNSLLTFQYGINHIHTFHNGFLSDSVHSYLEMDDNKKKQIKCLRGHINFGLHEYLRSSDQGFYVSLIRSPVERVLSTFGYISGYRGDDLLRKEVQSKLLVFLEEGHPGYIHNDQTRRVAGRSRDIKVTSLDLEIAQRNVDKHFLVVGVTDKFEQTVLLMKRVLGWTKPPFFIRNNIHKSGGLKARISEEIINIIQSQNYLDKQLYDFASNRLDSQFFVHGLSIKDLDSFNYINSNFVANLAPPIVSLMRL
jgi:hypothetical protein